MYGRVQQAIVFGYDDLNRLSTSTTRAALYCVTEPGHPEHLLSGEWRGIALTDLLLEAQLQPDANSAIIYSADGNRLALPAARLENAMLATQFNGDLLTLEQGFPVRLIVPGLTACDMPRWVERIEWVTEVVSPPIAAENITWITSPKQGEVLSQQVQIQGLAIAVNDSISSIELSIDDGDWFSIPIHVEINQMASWSLEWTPPSNGQYGLRVRTYSSLAAHSVMVTVS